MYRRFIWLLLLLAALLLFISGLILSTLQEKDKRDFEFQLQQVSDQYRKLCREADKAAQ